MAKKYTKESDFKLLNYRVKARIKGLLERRVTRQTVGVLTNEFSGFSYDIKREIIEYMIYLTDKIGYSDPGAGGYAVGAMNKSSFKSENAFYITQMRRLLIEDVAKQKEGKFKERNYLSSNTIYAEDVENEIQDKTIEMTEVANQYSVDMRYIIEATDSNNRNNKDKDKTDSITQPLSQTGMTSKMQELLKQKEEEERKEMEELRKRMAEERRQEELGGIRQKKK